MAAESAAVPEQDKPDTADAATATDAVKADAAPAPDSAPAPAAATAPVAAESAAVPEQDKPDTADAATATDAVKADAAPAPDSAPAPAAATAPVAAESAAVPEQDKPDTADAATATDAVKALAVDTLWPLYMGKWAGNVTDNTADKRENNIYVVQPGDTLESVSKKTGVPVKAIKAANSWSPSKPVKAITYRVRGGESLYLISKALGIKYKDVIAANGLTDLIIRPYQELLIPGIGGAFDYIIKPRDTLFYIGKALGLDYTDIMVANGLTGDLIFPGQELIIPDIDQASGVAAENTGQRQSVNQQLELVSDLASDLELLARVVYSEARGESVEGQVAVAAVVLNRLQAAGFPKSIRDIIYQPGAFTAVDDGQINLAPDRNAYDAAQKALDGYDPSAGALYYWNPDIATSRWIWTREVMLSIGNHLFGI